MTLAKQGPITRDPGPMTLAIGWPHDPGENVGRWPHVPGDRHAETPRTYEPDQPNRFPIRFSTEAEEDQKPSNSVELNGIEPSAS